MLKGGARGPEVKHHLHYGIVFICKLFISSYFNSYLLKAFVLGPKEHCRIGFHSMTSDPRVRCRDGARGQNLVHLN